MFEKLEIITTFPKIHDCEDVQGLGRDLLEVNRMLLIGHEYLTA